MIRKAFFGLLLLAVGSYMWCGTRIGSYSRTAFSSLTGMVQEQVPIEFKIQHIKQKLKELDPEIKNAQRQIAEQEVKVERTKKDIAATKGSLREKQEFLAALNVQLKQNLASYNLGDKKFTRRQLETEAARQFGRIQNVEATLKAHEDILSSRSEALDAVRDRYSRLVVVKQKISAEVEALETQLKVFEANNAEKEVKFDDTKLAEIDALMAEVHDQIEEKKIVTQMETEIESRLSSDDLPAANLSEKIEDYLKSKNVTVETGTKL